MPEQKFKIPDDLYEFQKEDSLRMLSEGNWLNLSQMGTGKTPVTLGAIEQGGFQSPFIVCPNSVKSEWKRIIKEWTGHEAAVSTSDTFTRLEPIVMSFVKGQKYRVTNYETLRDPEAGRKRSRNNPMNYLEVLKEVPMDVIVFDEVHKTRNPDTKLVPGIWRLLEDHPDAKVIALTGSPIMNYPPDLYVPLSLVKPQSYIRDKRHYKFFMQDYAYMEEGRFGVYVSKGKNLDHLARTIEPFTIRRLKKDILPFLPEKSYRYVELEMSPRQKKLYKDVEQQISVLLDTGESLQAKVIVELILRLRQMNLDPKILGVDSPSAKTEFLFDLIEEIGDQKVVVFSTFETYANYIHRFFPDNSLLLTGKTPTDLRGKVVETFQTDPSKNILLATIQTAGEGITLTAAHTVVLMDRWWNSPSNEQAIDRLHRPGQTEKVEVIIPICEDSVDMFLGGILEKKDEDAREFYNELEIQQTIMAALKGMNPMD